MTACTPAPRLITFPCQKKEDSTLSIYTALQEVPFEMKRVFVVQVESACTRGRHAHKACSQLLVCVKGSCTVTVDDGSHQEDFFLDAPETGLLIPPGLWAQQRYAAESVLMVLADQPYDEADYIRDYTTFQVWKKAQS